MQSKFSFRSYRLQGGGAGCSLIGDRNRAKMRGPEPTNLLLLTNLPLKVAHFCAVSPPGTRKSPPLTSPNWEIYETNPRTAHHERLFARVKRVSSKNTAQRFGFASQHCLPKEPALRASGAGYNAYVSVRGILASHPPLRSHPNP